MWNVEESSSGVDGNGELTCRWDGDVVSPQAGGWEADAPPEWDIGSTRERSWECDGLEAGAELGNEMKKAGISHWRTGAERSRNMAMGNVILGVGPEEVGMGWELESRRWDGYSDSVRCSSPGLPWGVECAAVEAENRPLWARGGEGP